VGLKRYVAKKTVQALLSLLAVTVICFVVFQILPQIVGCPGKTQLQCLSLLYVPTHSPGGPQGVVQTWGFLQPTPVRLLIYIRNMLTLNFGFNEGSLYSSSSAFGSLPLPVSNTIGQTLPFSLFLLGSSTLAAAVIGTGLASIVAARRGKVMDVLLQAFSLLVLSLPAVFLCGLVVRGEALVTPASIGPLCCYAARRFFLSSELLKAFALPFATLTLIGVCCVFLVQRRSETNDSGPEHLLLARAKGVPEHGVLLKHALRGPATSLPRTLIISMGVILSADVMIENIFNWPGLGQAILFGEIYLDLPLEQAIFFVLAAIMIAARYIVDIAAGLLDPSIARS